jgi:hypothetical protein
MLTILVATVSRGRTRRHHCARSANTHGRLRRNSSGNDSAARRPTAAARLSRRHSTAAAARARRRAGLLELRLRAARPHRRARRRRALVRAVCAAAAADAARHARLDLIAARPGGARRACLLAACGTRLAAWRHVARHRSRPRRLCVSGARLVCVW